jgi:MoxR-like ATPase
MFRVQSRETREGGGQVIIIPSKLIKNSKLWKDVSGLVKDNQTVQIPFEASVIADMVRLLTSADEGTELKDFTPTQTINTMKILSFIELLEPVDFVQKLAQKEEARIARPQWAQVPKRTSLMGIKNITD